MPSDFQNLKQSGSACVGCGRTKDQVVLLKLRTYGRSLACPDCFKQHLACGDCHCGFHFERVCQQCGCQEWRHGLETEFDRQQADCVGKVPLIHRCAHCGDDYVDLGLDKKLLRLCSTCDREWAELETRGLQ
jgi:hypothetical protein